MTPQVRLDRDDGVRIIPGPLYVSPATFALGLGKDECAKIPELYAAAVRDALKSAGLI